MKIRSRRVVASVAAVLAATSGSVLVAVSANAGSSIAGSRLGVDTTTIRAAAGSCAVVVITPQDQFGQPYSITDTFTVTLSENPSEANQDLDFCVSSPTDSSYTADKPVEDPSYMNGGAGGATGPTPSVRRDYKAGPGITNGAANSGGQPDESSNEKAPSGVFSSCDTSTSCDTSNPTGVDRAKYVYRPGSGGVRVGVVGLRAGNGVIKAFFDDGTGTNHTGNYAPDGDEVQSSDIFFTVTAGGQPGTAEAHAAVTKINVDPIDDAAPPGVAQAFTATLLNGSGDGVRGVRPLVAVDPNGANPNSGPTCTDSNNSGVSQCSFTGTFPGTDTLTVFVNRAGGSAGPDSFETKTVVTRTTTKPPVAAAEARFIDLTPKNQTTVAGHPASLTAAVTDVNGAPAQGVTVVFSESGPGSIQTTPPDTATATVVTDAAGRARVRINTLASEQGTETITATITTSGTQCSQQAGAGNGSTSSTPAGRCSDTATNTITSSTPSPSPSTAPRPLTLTLDSPGTIVPGVQSRMTARGVAGSAVVLRCYSRTPQNASEQSPAYFDARSAVLNSSGSVQFVLNPGTNTRCFVKYAGSADSDTRTSPSIVQNVATNLSLSAYRDGVRKYHFQGTNLPRRAGQLITLYRYATGPRLDQYCVPAPESYTRGTTFGCTAIRTATAFTNSSNVWRIDRTFTGSGRFYFVVRTSNTMTNVAGFSNQRLTIIH